MNDPDRADLRQPAATALDTLALDCGIEPGFVDAHGNEQQTPAATKRALLAAMGVRAESDDDIGAALRARAAQRWERALPPALVLPAGSALDIPVVLPAATRGLRWTLTLEAGDLRCGDADFSQLPLLERGPAGEAAREQRALRLPADIPAGYHRLALDDQGGELHLIISPGACWLPEALAGGARLSGIAVQLYLLRSAANWGIGDYSDLRRFVERVAHRGADVVGLNPLHELFPDDPEQASPYSPESRLLLNTLNIDVTAIAGFDTCQTVQAFVKSNQFEASLETCRTAALVEYSKVATLKRTVLRLLFDEFSKPGNERRAGFERFRAAASPALERTFVFAALRAHFAALDESRAGWQHWPQSYHDPASAAVAAFAHEHAAEVEFVAWLQWIADEQLAAVAQAAGPMRVGLYRDLAVGADPAGAETWSNARAIVDAARVGAPPDIYNPAGQNWGLPPFDPFALRLEGYATFIELVRANMRYAGALRIDHVMALAHLYWIPNGSEPPDGAYVRYPLDDLVGIIALESHRARCLVVGEDLGTVPAGFRERMAQANILSYRVLFFEREKTGEFVAPEGYPRSALAVLGSHDLPTLRAWWSGADIRLRRRLGLYVDAAAVDVQRRQRDAERDAFVRALRAAELLTDDAELDADVLFVAAHSFLARTAAVLAMPQLDDITGEVDPVNVPTTSDEHPNWRRRNSLGLEELEAQPRFRALFALLGAAGRLRDVAPGSAASAPTVKGDAQPARVEAAREPMPARAPKSAAR